MVGGRTEGVPGEVSPHQMGRGSPRYLWIGKQSRLSVVKRGEGSWTCKNNTPPF